MTSLSDLLSPLISKAKSQSGPRALPKAAKVPDLACAVYLNLFEIFSCCLTDFNLKENYLIWSDSIQNALYIGPFRLNESKS